MSPHLYFNLQNEVVDSTILVIVKAQPGEAFENERIAFLYSVNGLNIELIDTSKRANRI